MNKSEHIRKKRAIYTGLHPYLSEDQLMEALIIWESKYANGPGFSVRYYVAELMDRVQPTAEAKKILVTLVSTLGKSEDVLLPDPSRALDDYKRFNRIQVNANFSIPILEAFQIFIVKWLKFAPPKAAEAILKDVIRDIPDLNIDLDLQQSVLDWTCKKIDRMRLPHVDASDLRRVVNVFYVAFCRHHGPTATDEILSKAVTALRSNGGAAYTELFNKIL